MPVRALADSHSTNNHASVLTQATQRKPLRILSSAVGYRHGILVTASMEASLGHQAFTQVLAPPHPLGPETPLSPVCTMDAPGRHQVCPVQQLSDCPGRQQEHPLQHSPGHRTRQPPVHVGPMPASLACAPGVDQGQRCGSRQAAEPRAPRQPAGEAGGQPHSPHSGRHQRLWLRPAHAGARECLAGTMPPPLVSCDQALAAPQQLLSVALAMFGKHA